MKRSLKTFSNLFTLYLCAAAYVTTLVYCGTHTAKLTKNINGDTLILRPLCFYFYLHLPT
jgi:hypothetical protein